MANKKYIALKNFVNSHIWGTLSSWGENESEPFWHNSSTSKTFKPESVIGTKNPIKPSTISMIPTTTKKEIFTQKGDFTLIKNIEPHLSQKIKSEIKRKEGLDVDYSTLETT